MKRFWRWFGQRIRMELRGEKFLCDSCKYNWRDACIRPERPNATSCPEYKRKIR